MKNPQTPIGRFQFRILTGFDSKTKLAYQASGQTATEAIENIRTVAALNKEQFWLKQYLSQIEDPYHLGESNSHRHGHGESLNLYALNSHTWCVSILLGLCLLPSDGFLCVRCWLCIRITSRYLANPEQ